jgi:hypothetical protein
VVTFEKSSNPLSVLGRTGRRRQDPEPSGQHVLPVHSDLPGAAFVSEEQDVIVAFVDLAQPVFFVSPLRCEVCDERYFRVRFLTAPSET